MNGYGPISRVYDRLNGDIDYGAWADGVESAFLRLVGKKPELVLDLACGTGSITLLRVVPEGKKPMAAADFVRGRQCAVGDIFE